jgi:hypothetical protein
MANLQVRVEQVGGVSRVYLKGPIDEHCQLKDIFAPLEGELVINLEGIERINSMGVHRWVQPFDALTQRARVTVEAISYPVVLQANCVANLFGAAHVISCVAPFFCDRCRVNRTVIVKVDALGPAGQPPSAVCPQCNVNMIFDELEEYFNFCRPKK